MFAVVDFALEPFPSAGLLAVRSRPTATGRRVRAPASLVAVRGMLKFDPLSCTRSCSTAPVIVIISQYMRLLVALLTLIWYSQE